MRRSRLRLLVVLGLLLGALPVGAAPGAAYVAADDSVFISEIHYDNAGTDANEAIEVFGPAGTDLTGWSIVLYNGSNGSVYGTTNLSGTIPDLGDGFGVVVTSYPVNGIQNGSPDGMALVDDGGVVRQFLSYGGAFTAAGGPANGLTSTDIGVSETGSGADTESLQVTGSGSCYEDLMWATSAPNTFGSVTPITPDPEADCGGGAGGGGGELPPVHFSEIHYDNAGTDTNEAIEVFGPAGTDLTGWSIVLYNGSNGTAYDTIALSGVIPDLAAGFGVVVVDFPSNGIQNGSPDGMALVDGDEVVEFLSYEGSFDAADGPAIGMTSSSIGVAESGSAFADQSLQRSDTGTWSGPACNSFGELNIPSPDEVCPPSDLMIHDIQGSGLAVTNPATLARVEGLVVGDYQGGNELSGFFLEEEGSDFDADPATSEGIFVYCGSCTVAVAEGDLVQVVGVQEEYFGMSQLDVAGAGSYGEVVVTSSGNPMPPASTVSLPATASTAAEGTFESLEGMLVTFDDVLTATEYFQLARFGQIVLSQGGKLRQFTNDNVPSAAGYATYLDDISKRRIILDDLNNIQNIDPVYHPQPGGFAVDNYIRGGDTITDLTGVLHWSFAGSSGTDAWRVRPQISNPVSFDRDNPRQDAPDDVGGDIKVATLNVLNYFTTVNESGNTCGPIPEECRGANSEAERIRQLDKLVAALSGIDADVVGLVELENNASASLESITAALSAATGHTYDYVDAGTVGLDVIKVGLIYNADTVSASGSYAVLNSLEFTDPNDTGELRNRAALAETFTENATGESFVAVVNHLKSKGSGCGPGDDDTTTGQGNCNLTRTLAAMELADWLASDPTGSGDPDVIVIGDLNSYAMEDPVTALERGADDTAGTSDDYVDLVDAFGADDPYSYVFDGQWGYLDHALATGSLASRVTGVTHWHINADENSLLDYNDTVVDSTEASFEAKPATNPLYAPDAFRSSDHDPVIIGLNLANPRGDKADLADELGDLVPSGHWRTDLHLAWARILIKASLFGDWWTSDQTITTKWVFDLERQAVAHLARVARSDRPEAAAAQEGIMVLLNADRQLAQIELLAAIARDGDGWRIDRAQRAMERAESHIAAGRYAAAVNAYKAAWDAAHKA